MAGSNGFSRLKLEVEEAHYLMGRYQALNLSMGDLRWAGSGVTLDGDGLTLVNKAYGM